MNSILTKKQVKIETKQYTDNGVKCKLEVKIRYDDSCGNGHNSFAITANGYEYTGRGWRDTFGGCCHDEIIKRFPHLAKYIKWHLCSSDEPMHYIANTLYHAGDVDCNKLRKGEFRSFVYKVKVGPEVLFTSKIFYSFRNWLHRDEARAQAESFLQNIKPELKPEIVQVGSGSPSEGKERELDMARNSAIWPEATDEQLTSPDLEQMLRDRHPALMAEFKAAMIELGFTY
jgi:hypothetical protein